MTAQEIAQNMTKCPWVVKKGETFSLMIDSLKDVDPAISVGASFTSLRWDNANAQAIVTAVNATYGAGYDPQKIEPLINVVNKWKRKMWHSDAAKEINAAIDSLCITKQDTEK